MKIEAEHQRIGMNVLCQRRLRGWTQEELSARSGLSRARISNIEHGRESFTLTTIMNIGKAFGLDYKELLK